MPLSLQHPGLIRVFSIARKELLHVAGDRMMLFFMFLVPVSQTILLGFAININVRDIPTVVLDEAQTQSSRAFLRRFKHSDTFALKQDVTSRHALNEALRTGTARVGIRIPSNYSRNLLRGESAHVLMLVDGTEPRTASEAVHVGSAVALAESLDWITQRAPLPIEDRPRVLFDPNLRSANFILPGVTVVLIQMTAVFLAATAIVQEKENGSLEQLLLTPLRTPELIVGKLVPHLLISLLGYGLTVATMILVFHVQIQGSWWVLFAIIFPFILTMLGIGLSISAWASTRDAAAQIAMGTVVPSLFLTGLIYPIDSLPTPFWYLAHVMPATWSIDAVRGVVVRGVGFHELWLHFAVLWGLALIQILASTLTFAKRFR